MSKGLSFILKMDLTQYKPPARAEKKSGEPRTQREELLDKFLSKLNPDREKAGFPPYSHARLARMLKGMTTQQLYILFRECDQARSFGGLLKWKLKNVPTNQ
jgi:hypothetical protein